MARYKLVRSDLDVVKKAIDSVGRFRFLGRPDPKYLDAIEALRKEVEELLKKANADHSEASKALDEIGRLRVGNAELHGVELGRVAEVARESHRKITA